MYNNLNDCLEVLHSGENDEIINTLAVTKTQIKRAINKMKPNAGKADILRYLIMYIFGGVYIDVDATCIVPLSSIIKYDDEIVSGLGARKDLHQWVLAYYPNHPIMKLTLETAVNNVLNECWINSYPQMPNKVPGLTGPPVLHFCATKLFGKSKTHNFKSGNHIYNNLKLRILKGNHFGNKMKLNNFTSGTKLHWSHGDIFDKNYS